MRFISEKRGHKFYLALVCEMERTNLATCVVDQVKEACFRTQQVPVHRATDLEVMYENRKAKMLE